MDLQTITMPPDEALAALRHYEDVLTPGRRLPASVRRRFEGIRDSYEALAEGVALLELGPTIESGGFDEKGRPRLAVARSDRERVRLMERWRHARALRFLAQTEEEADVLQKLHAGLQGDVEEAHELGLVTLTPWPTRSAFGDEIAEGFSSDDMSVSRILLEIRR